MPGIQSKSVIISVGGSLIVPDKIDSNFLKSFRDMILRHASKRPPTKFMLISGGGKTARNYQEAASSIHKVSPDDLDWIGIHATRLNGHLLRTVFEDIAYKRILKNPTEKVSFGKSKIIVAAGWKPGCSTDYDSVLFAKTHGIKILINLTNVDYIYDKDPKQFRDAKPLKQISWKYYRQMVGDKWSPGLNAPFDPIAAKEAEKLGLTVYVINGKNLNSLENILEGKPFIGTILK